ncbi:MAG: MarR family winged helix-turn-helix transcriptional regulator [Caulobacter sp.]|jgi:DNA-binding MarR family transcriptional regulator
MTSPPRLFFLLSAANRRVQRWAESEMAADGLTSAQAGVLFTLGGKDGALIGAVCEALDAAPSAMSGLIDRMERAGLVERRPDPDDGRAQRLFLTDRGREARSRARDGLAAANARLTEGFSDDEIAVIGRWLSGLAQPVPKGDRQ